jgi:hypothetical protein
MDRYRIELNEVQSTVDGDVAVAWGISTGDFKEKGRSPKTVRVRFSFTFKYDGGNWRTLFYHRDHQTFDAQGACVRNPSSPVIPTVTRGSRARSQSPHCHPPGPRHHADQTAQTRTSFWVGSSF